MIIISEGRLTTCGRQALEFGLVCGSIESHKDVRDLDQIDHGPMQWCMGTTRSRNSGFMAKSSIGALTPAQRVGGGCLAGD